MALITLWISKFPCSQWILRAIPRPESKPIDPVVRADNLWSTREDWVKGEIVYGNQSGLVVAWISTLLFNVFAWYICYLLQQKELLENPFAWLFMIPVLAGLLMLTHVIRRSIRYKNFGTSTFKMLSIPGQIGGSLAGVIEVGGKLHPKDGFVLTLRCIQGITPATANDPQIEQGTIWEEKKIVDQMQDLDRHRSGIPVFYEIPASCSATSSFRGVSWHLLAEASVDGVDFSARFEVPVFETSSPHAQQICPTEFAMRYEKPSKLAKK